MSGVASRRTSRLLLLGSLVLLALMHAATHQPSEPFFRSDETRHVMTGVFFRDALVDLPVTSLRQ